MSRAYKPRSNTSTQPCKRCGNDIHPYAGRAGNAYGDTWFHHPGQCSDVSMRDAEVRELAGQGSLFAWRCDRVEPSERGGSAEVCSCTSTDRDAFVAHMKAHGATMPQSPKMIRLRRKPPAAKFPASPCDKPFKWLRWTEVKYGAWQAGIGNPVIAEAERRGQYWCDAGPHSIVVVPFELAPWETKRTFVTLYSHGDGTWSADWSNAKRDRTEGNRRARRAIAA